MPEPRVDQLGFYTLGGHVESPKTMLDELAEAEAMGQPATTGEYPER